MISILQQQLERLQVSYGHRFPSNYSLFAQSDIDSATAAGQTTGINSVTSSPSNYGLFVQSDLDAKFAEGNASGIAYVQANPEKFNFLTDAEKNASYDLGYAAGLAEAEASGLAEAQAKLAVENLSSLTYLDEIRALPQTKPYTEGWYFQPGLGWLWTNNSTFPFIFRQAAEGGEGSWLYFSQLPEQSLKPYYDYDAEKWISASGN